MDVFELFGGISGIDFIEFEKSDVMRHRLVMEIVAAYERDAEKKQRINGDSKPI